MGLCEGAGAEEEMAEAVAEERRKQATMHREKLRYVDDACGLVHRGGTAAVANAQTPT